MYITKKPNLFIAPINKNNFKNAKSYILLFFMYLYKDYTDAFYKFTCFNLGLINFHSVPLSLVQFICAKSI